MAPGGKKRGYAPPRGPFPSHGKGGKDQLSDFRSAAFSQGFHQETFAALAYSIVQGHHNDSCESTPFTTIHWWKGCLMSWRRYRHWRIYITVLQLVWLVGKGCQSVCEVQIGPQTAVPEVLGEFGWNPRPS